MCIIVAKPAGIAMPSFDTLKTCFDYNPDGAGIMFPKNGNVHIEKGFMKYDVFSRYIKNLKESMTLTDIPVIMHFRIATHGTVNIGNCHPFPITNDYKKMKRVETDCRIGVAHNGIIAETSSMSDLKLYDVSDTMAFIRYFIYPMAKTYGGASGFVKYEELIQALASACGGKLAFIDGNGNMSLGGHFIENDGVYYSNSTFRTYRTYNNKKYKYANDYEDYANNFSWADYYGGGNSLYGPVGEEETDDDVKKNKRSKRGSRRKAGFAESLPLEREEIAEDMSIGDDLWMDIVEPCLPNGYIVIPFACESVDVDQMSLFCEPYQYALSPNNNLYEIFVDARTQTADVSMVQEAVYLITDDNYYFQYDQLSKMLAM